MGVLENPLNLLLIPPILYLLYVMILPPHPEVLKTVPRTYDAETYNWLPAKHPDVILYRNYTAGELAKYDGKDDGKILLAIMNVGRAGKIPEGGKCERTVFDVTRGSNFYGPDGMYGNFAGRDASRGMAKQSFEEGESSLMLTPIDQPLDTLADLTAAEIYNMAEWHEHFANKYVICGELVNNEEDTSKAT